jgi:hypothetical protein
LTDNGLHLTPYGYWRVGKALVESLGVKVTPARWTVEIDASAGSARGLEGTTVENLIIEGTTIAFQATDPRLWPVPPAASTPDRAGSAQPRRMLRLQGFTPGRYTLEIDGKADRTFTVQGALQVVYFDPPDNRAETLRQTILAKNELYFHRWRPQNETYLFGFRKHEQGNNAVEIPRFDPLVAEQEARIRELLKPVSHTYTIRRKEVGQ